MTNVFAQSAENWEVDFEVAYGDLHKFLIFLETISETIAYYEKEKSKFVEARDTDVWVINVHFNEKPNLQELQEKISQIAEIFEIPQPVLTLRQTEDVDWVKIVQENFKPFNVGEFLLYNEMHEKGLDFSGKIPIKMSAGRAFGTGEHETTAGCLLALLEQKNNFAKILDLGTGSGILAIAARRIWPDAQIMASDIDEESVKTAKGNFEQNEVFDVQIHVSDGYQAKEISQNGPYDLIISNILAQPLIEMAPDLAANLAINGMAILSGLMNYQEQEVIAAHEKAGLNLKSRKEHDGWSVLQFSKQV